MQIGIGYDIHKLIEGKKLVLGSVEIPYEKGFLAHTDGDVLIHSIIDALLGASGLGNIGEHFPDSEPKWKDANSMSLLEVVYIKIKGKGFKIVNIDSTIVVQEPKLSPYLNEMKKNISQALGISEEKIGIKPKTNEGLDSIGQKNAISAWSVALLN